MYVACVVGPTTNSKFFNFDFVGFFTEFLMTQLLKLNNFDILQHMKSPP